MSTINNVLNLTGNEQLLQSTYYLSSSEYDSGKVWGSYAEFDYGLTYTDQGSNNKSTVYGFRGVLEF